MYTSANAYQKCRCKAWAQGAKSFKDHSPGAPCPLKVEGANVWFLGTGGPNINDSVPTFAKCFGDLGGLAKGLRKKVAMLRRL